MIKTKLAIAALLLVSITSTAWAGCSFFSAPEQPCTPAQSGHARPINVSPTTGRSYSGEGVPVQPRLVKRLRNSQKRR
jgi:hypothetical protein